MKQVKANDIEEIDNPDANVLDDEFETIQEIPSIQEILLSLISDKTNLTLKTEIHNPKALALIKMFSNYLEQRQYPKSSQFISNFIDIYLEYMVSKDRESRREIIKAISSWIERYDVNEKGNLTVQ